MASFVVIVTTLVAWRLLGEAGPVIETADTSLSPSESLQQDLLRADLGQPGDPLLQARFIDINTRYFGGALENLPVRWEPRLADVGVLADHAFTLEGLFGHVGSRQVILLNPTLQSDDQAIQRALCHEMVHAWLFSTGDSTTSHGPAFQAALRRLSTEGAFAGTPASDAERTTLRQWLDAESARLDREREAMDAIGADLDRERAEVEQTITDLNARMHGGTAADAPSPDALAEADARRGAYNEHVAETTARSARDRADVDHFNAEVARYNLMLVYPDGLDEHPFAQPKRDIGR